MTGGAEVTGPGNLNSIARQVEAESAYLKKEPTMALEFADSDLGDLTAGLGNTLQDAQQMLRELQSHDKDAEMTESVVGFATDAHEDASKKLNTLNQRGNAGLDVAIGHLIRGQQSGEETMAALAAVRARMPGRIALLAELVAGLEEDVATVNAAKESNGQTKGHLKTATKTMDDVAAGIRRAGSQQGPAAA